MTSFHLGIGQLSRHINRRRELWFYIIFICTTLSSNMFMLCWKLAPSGHPLSLAKSSIWDFPISNEHRWKRLSRGDVDVDRGVYIQFSCHLVSPDFEPSQFGIWQNNTSIPGHPWETDISAWYDGTIEKGETSKLNSHSSISGLSRCIEKALSTLNYIELCEFRAATSPCCDATGIHCMIMKAVGFQRCVS